MKKLLFLSIIAVASIYSSCKDNNTLDILDSDISSAELAADKTPLDDYLKVTIREEGKPERTKYLAPQRWDGHSALMPGVQYMFVGLDEAMAAFSDNPGVLKVLETLGKLPEKKEKVVDGVNLASGSWSATVWHEHPPGALKAKAITTNPSGSSGAHHYFLVLNVRRCPAETVYFDDEVIESSAAAELEWQKGQNCSQVPDWETRAWVTYGGQTRAYDHDIDACPGD